MALTEIIEDRVDAFDALLGEDADQEAMPEFDELGIRDLLIDIAARKREIERLKRLKGSVAETYAERLRLEEAKLERERGWLETWVADNGKVDFPDVGKAHLTTRPAKWNVASEQPLRTHPQLSEFVHPSTTYVFDQEGFAAWADEHLTVTEKGVVIVKETGEAVEGVEYVPERKSITVSV